LDQLLLMLDAAGRERVAAARGLAEELEIALWQEAGRLGLRPFEAELQRVADETDQPDPECGSTDRTCPYCGSTVGPHRKKERKLLTGLGEAKFRRTEYHCTCGKLFAPADRTLGIRRDTRLSPALERIAADMGSSCGSFEEAQELIRRFLGAHVGPTARTIAKAVDRIASDLDAADEIGDRDDPRVRPPLSPFAADSGETVVVEVDGGMVPTATDGRGPTQWREVKVGAVYRTSDRVVKPTTSGGLPGRARVRHASTVARLEPWEPFAQRFYREALRRGIERAGRVVLLGDGAAWIDQMRDEFFPDAIRILDFWHALEHLCAPARFAFDGDEAAFHRYRRRQSQRLLAGKWTAMISALHALKSACTASRRPELARQIAQECAYFSKRRDQIDYPRYLAWGLPIGSGLIEGRIKNLVKHRLCTTGARWSVDRANSMLTVRTHLQAA
jgi:hypothetical protein